MKKVVRYFMWSLSLLFLVTALHDLFFEGIELYLIFALSVGLLIAPPIYSYIKIKLILKIILILFLLFFSFYFASLEESHINLPYDEINFNISYEHADYSSSLPQDYSIISSGNKDDFSDTGILHFGHIPIIYKFSTQNQCKYSKKKDVLYALNEITYWTNSSVIFEEGEDYDLIINCYLSQKDEVIYKDGYKTQTLGEGGQERIEGNLIITSLVNFYPVEDSCGYYPFVEIHELMHALGYLKHVENNAFSIMSPSTNCEEIYNVKKKPYIDKYLLESLIGVYGDNQTIPAK